MLQKFHILDINRVTLQFTNYFMANAYTLIVITIIFNRQVKITKLVLNYVKIRNRKLKINKNCLAN